MMNKDIARNRSARYEYAIGDELEVGMVLTGSEVKSLRTGQVNISESYVRVEGGELWLVNSHIASLLYAGKSGHEERRARKLLASRRQISKLQAARDRDGMTLVALRIYFNDRGRAKLVIAEAKGKRLCDKRATEAKRDWDRQRARMMKVSGS
ncbi:MAG: SsrA-binding protein SmpB [Oceanicaulis sp.]|nr:SsrA-binding protein SmpB [Oceanicaulis sp.]